MSQSTLEMASYLEQIEYVPKKIIDDIVRSRRMEIDVVNKNALGKLVAIIKNIDIYFFRIIWKLRGQIGKIQIQER